MTSIPVRELPAALAASLTPREIVAELDKYVVGQAKAKRAVAIALRNRYRRQRLPKDMADEVAPKNILMIGPTGVGKTEIARRLARLAQSPFVKVEASKFTEVGYVGRDVESMVRDLVEIAVKMVREEREGGSEGARAAGRRRAAARSAVASVAAVVVRRVVGGGTDGSRARLDDPRPPARAVARRPSRFQDGRDRSAGSRRCRRSSWCRARLSRRSASISRTCCPGIFPGRTRRRRLPVSEALEHLTAEEAQKLIDMDGVARSAIERVEQAGIIFVDEIDKIAGREGAQGTRREPRGRAARHPADRRGHDGELEVRHGANRSHPVHRRRRVPRVEAVGPDSGAAGTVPDSGRARSAGQRRVRPDSDGAQGRARSSSTPRCSPPRA